METPGTNLKFHTSHKAYIGLHKYFLNNHEELINRGLAFLNGDTLQVFNPQIDIEFSILDEDFDFFYHFAYTKSKWTSLVNNYVDFNQLDLVKGDILSRESKKAVSYNISFSFGNSHSNGKGCLMTLVFSRRPDKESPILHAYMRASEMTKRLIFDLTLLDRIGKYVYGKEVRFSIHIQATMMYVQGSNSFPMWDKIVKMEKFLKPIRGTKLYNNLIKHRDKYLNIDVGEVVYGAHKRNAWVLQGLNPFKRNPLKISDCTFKPFKDYPEGIVTAKQRKEYDRNIRVAKRE